MSMISFFAVSLLYSFTAFIHLTLGYVAETTNNSRLSLNKQNIGHFKGQEKNYSTQRTISSIRKKRGAIANAEKLWNSGVIPYEIAYNYSGKGFEFSIHCEYHSRSAEFIKSFSYQWIKRSFLKMIHESMQMWMNGTCVAFVEKQKYHDSWLRIQPGPCGCCSQVGRQTVGLQYLYLSEECDKVGIIAHELGHAMGFWHEHTRPDRDDYIYVLEENVDQDQKYNFLKKSYEDVDSLGEPYDPLSIMHYAANTFSKSELSFTILLKETSAKSYTDEDFLNAMGQLGQRVRPSTGDISQTNKLYRCPPCGGNVFLYEMDEWIHIEPQDPISHCQYCGWRFITSPGSTISVQIEKVRLIYGQFAAMYDGFQKSSTAIIAYMDGFKRLLRSKLISSREYLFLALWDTQAMEANPDDSVFRINVKATCGGNISAESGYLSNPGYPSKYSKANTVCDWVIKAKEDQSVHLDIYYYSFEGADRSGSVAIYEGNRDEKVSPLVYILQDAILEEGSTNLHSITNTLRIMMNIGENGSITFLAKYYAQDNPCKPMTYGCEQLCSNVGGKPFCSCDIGYWLSANQRSCETYESVTDPTCKQTINITRKRRSGKINSPIDPETQKYPGNLDCYWLIKAPRLFVLKIKFSYMEIEGSKGYCSYDRLEIHQLDNSMRKKINSTVYCGNVPPASFYAMTGIVNITFQSDESVGGKGFELHYIAVLRRKALEKLRP